MPELTCTHNQRCRYAHGFFCEDCNTFFARNSATYRSGELLRSIWMVLNNINATSLQSGGPGVQEALAMRDKIGIGTRHDDYEALIAEAEVVMAKHRVTVRALVPKRGERERRRIDFGTA